MSFRVVATFKTPCVRSKKLKGLFVRVCKVFRDSYMRRHKNNDTSINLVCSLLFRPRILTDSFGEQFWNFFLCKKKKSERSKLVPMVSTRIAQAKAAMRRVEASRCVCLWESGGEVGVNMYF